MRPWLHEPEPEWLEGRLDGFVIEDDGWYWTGMPGDEAWSRNPRRALVDAIAPWDLKGSRQVERGRCVRVLLEDEVTMLPLRHWSRGRGMRGRTDDA